MRKVLLALCSLGMLAMAGYVALPVLLPCHRPITYFTGSVDPRFGMSMEEFSRSVDRAATIWNTAAGKELFRRAETGRLPVSAVYDRRQEAVEEMQRLGLRIDSGQQVYEGLKARYDSMKAAYDDENAEYGEAVHVFEADKQAFEAEVDAASADGMTPSEHAALESKRAALNARVPVLQRRFTALEATRKELNTAVNVLNRMAAAHNESADEYREVGDSIGGEYEAGVYIRAGGRERIDVYAFATPEELLNLLAHEFGHALGLPHSEDPKAVMYRLNESQQGELSAADRMALAERCGL